MIGEPWIILMIDRSKLGAPIYAVGRRRQKPSCFRETPKASQLQNARKITTQKKADVLAKKLNDACPRTLFVAMRIGPGDFVQSRPHLVEIQLNAFEDAEGGEA